MELPIIDSSTHSPVSLVRTIRKAMFYLACASAEPHDLNGARAFCTPGRRQATLPNSVFDLAVPEHEDAARVIDEVFSWYESQGSACRGILCADDESQAGLAAELLNRNWQPDNVEILQLETLNRELFSCCDINVSEPGGNNSPPVQILPARALKESYREFMDTLTPLTTCTSTGCHVEQLDCTQYEVYLARISKQVLAEASVMCMGDTGVIWTLNQSSNTGAETALLHLLNHVFDLCSRSQFKVVCAPVFPGEITKKEYLLKSGMNHITSFTIYRPG